MSNLGLFLLGMFGWASTLALGAWIINGPPPGLTYDDGRFWFAMLFSATTQGILICKAMGGYFRQPKGKPNAH